MTTKKKNTTLLWWLYFPTGRRLNYHQLFFSWSLATQFLGGKKIIIITRASGQKEKFLRKEKKQEQTLFRDLRWDDKMGLRKCCFMCQRININKNNSSAVHDCKRFFYVFIGFLSLYVGFCSGNQLPNSISHFKKRERERRETEIFWHPRISAKTPTPLLSFF